MKKVSSVFIILLFMLSFAPSALAGGGPKGVFKKV